MTLEGDTPELPPRDPRSLLVHFAVDAAVAFLVLVLVLLIFEVSIWVIIAIAALLGAALAPVTRRAEERALAERYATGGGRPSA